MAKSGLLPQIVLGPVLAGIGDAHPRVRYAALACLGQMAEDFSDWDGGGDEDDDAGGMEGGESFIGVFHSQVGYIREAMCLKAGMGEVGRDCQRVVGG